MRKRTVLKILICILIATVLGIFYRQNTGPVDIQVPFGQPRNFGLIYLLLISYGLGVVTTLYVLFVVNAKRKKKRSLADSQTLVEDD